MEIAKRISEDIREKNKYGYFITEKQRHRAFDFFNKHYKKTDIIEPWIALEILNNKKCPVKEPLVEDEIIYLIKEWKDVKN